MKKILVPCDFSQPSEEAFKYAVHLATHYKLELHVLFVIDLTLVGGSPKLSNSYVFNTNYLTGIEKDAEKKFQVMWERHAPLSLGVIFRHRTGVLALEVEQYTKDYFIDLIVMGTTGSGGSKWGSNVEKIVRVAPVPVLAIRNFPKKPIENIVVPVSLLREDAKLIEKVKNLQQFYNATLHLLYVNTPMLFSSDSVIKKQLQALVEQHALTRCTVQFLSDYTIQEGISHFIKETNYDMIAMGTHAWKGLAHFFLGSVTEDIVNELHIPIWTCTIR